MGCVISLPLPLPWKPRRADTTSPTTARDESIRISDPVALGTIVRDTGTDGLDRERADALEESPEVMAAMDPRDESVAPGTSIAAPPSRSVDGSGESPEGTPILSAQTSSKRTGWLVLKRVLVAVKEGSDLFPPLKTALVGVLAVIDVVDCVGEAQDGFLAIARKIEGIQDIFSHYRSEGDIPFFVSKRLERLSAEFDSIKGIIETRMERGLLRRMIEAPGDVKDVESIFEALANMVERFKVR
ncbi:hypothetical protein OBBRIDRAFT_862666 [Obba rivulosa]|uniref:Uncharacterized protein n=1 Tax=Obba rivulosa TaxID=1052685 RepID=A0A8E2AIL8_9APHY|nr:hypothetical protein OBBRIDRAFT_862666 [Obba rivulosa]